MRTSSTTRRFHPLLPTVEEAMAGATLYSDHLPIAATIPLRDALGQSLRIASWNVMMPTPASSGFCNVDDCPETFMETLRNPNDARSGRVLNAILKIMGNPNLAVFFLQETWEALEIELEQNIITCSSLSSWGIIRSSDGMPLLYNSKYLKILAPTTYTTVPVGIPEYVSRTKGIYCDVVDAIAPLFLVNIYWPHRESPLEAESVMIKLIDIAEQQTDKPQLIFGGDFNNRMVWPDKSSLINNVVPPFFNPQHQQGADWTDWLGFMDHEYTVQPGQYMTSLNPETGAPFEEPLRLTQEQIEDLAPVQREEFLRVRPTFQPPDKKSKERGKPLSLSEVEDEVDAYFPTKNLVDLLVAAKYVFRKATNAFGHTVACATVVTLKDLSDDLSALHAAIRDQLSTLTYTQKKVSIHQSDEHTLDSCRFSTIIFHAVTIAPEQKTYQVHAFKKIYAALLIGQSNCFLKTNFLETLLDSGSDYFREAICQRYRQHPNGRTAKAWDLALKYAQTNFVHNLELFKEIYLYAFKQSGPLACSKITGITFFRSTALTHHSDRITEETMRAQEHLETRSGKILHHLRQK